MLGSLLIALVLICSSGGKHYQTVIKVDRIEVNTIVRNYHSGTHRFRQVIVWGWVPERAQYHVQEWFSCEDLPDEPSRDGRLPRQVGKDRWRYKYKGAADGNWYTIETDRCFYTTTEDVDPEVWDRQYWPDDLRVRLPGMVHHPVKREPVSILENPEVLTVPLPQDAPVIEPPE